MEHQPSEGCYRGKCETSDRQRVARAWRWIEATSEWRSRRAKCARWENETVRKVTGGSSHQNANAVWDIYCSVLMQFKTGSLSCNPSPSLCWALINQPLKADVTWIALHTAALSTSVGARKQLKNLWICHLRAAFLKYTKIKDLFLSWDDYDHNNHSNAVVLCSFLKFSFSKSASWRRTILANCSARY